MDIQFTVGNKTCVTSVNGTLSEVDLNEEETLLCGPLYGSVSGLNGSKVIVGFNQMLGCDDVSCYMTISMGNQTLVMRFGQDIFTPGQLSRLSDINNYEESDVDSELWTMDADDDEINITNYEKIGDVTATFDMMSNLSGAYGNAHKCEVYFKPATSIYDSENMLTFSVSSFCAELQAQFPYAYSSKIYEIETALLQADNTHGLVSPRVEDFNNYDELVIGQNNVNSGEAIIGMFAAIVQVLPLKCSYISAAVSFFSAWSPDDMSGISIYPRIYTAGNKLATTDTIFNTGRYFDDYPFLIELLLVGDRSQKTYNYVIESNVVYCQFSDGGYSYFSGNTASYEFSVDYVNI